MSKDKTAVSIPWPHGKAEGIINNKTIAHPWTPDGKPELDARAYVSNGRIAGLEARDATVHAYGVSRPDGITVRSHADGDTAHFVSSAWLVTNREPGDTLLVQAMEQLRNLDQPWQDINLSMDDGPIIGEHGAGIASLIAATTDADNWQCAVSGSLSLPGWRDMVLWPTVVERRQEGTTTVYKFFEGDSADHGRPELSITSDAATGQAPATYAIGLDALPVSPVLDDVADGVWERPEHLWIKARKGWLHVVHPQASSRLPYAISSETRVCDIGPGVPSVLHGLQGKLLLDRSGGKTLKLVLQDGKLIKLVLRVTAPAIAFQINGAALDGAKLSSSTCAPAQDGGAALRTLHLVPAALGGDALSNWSLSINADGGRLEGQWKNPADATAPVFHGPYNNWVLPPEAALNEGKGIASSRTLISLRSSSGAFTCWLGKGNVADVDGFETVAAAAFAHGPLARFALVADRADMDSAVCTEHWPDAAGPEMRHDEPAVLRPLYRLLPAELAQTLTPVSYEATLSAVAHTVVPDDHHPVTVGGGSGLARRPGTAVALVRWEPFRRGSAGEVGWEDRSKFVSFPSVIVDAQPQQLPWDWLEHRPMKADGSPQTHVLWLRLSDGSLIERPLPPGTVEETIAKLKQNGSDMDSARDPWNLLQAYKLHERGLGKIALFEVVNGDKSEFRLALTASPNEALTGPGATVTASASRIVAAWAGKQPAAVNLGYGIETAFLTRIFLEMEREAGSARIIRAMIGWEAARAFGLNASTMQVTEIYDSEDTVLVHKFEFNGIMRPDPAALGPQCELTIYCWDALLRPDAPDTQTLPVICHYLIKNENGTKTTQVCALQDARVRGDHLDLTADIAFFGTESDGVDGAATHPWEPDRRGLFSFKVSLHPNTYHLKGFIKVRMGGTAKASELTRNPSLMRLVPSWALCDREIVPRFTSMHSARHTNLSWCSKGLLRSVSGDANARYLHVQVFNDENFFSSPLNYGSTLIGESLLGAPVEHGLPSWIPSPIRAPSDPSSGAVEHARFRLWIFNPQPYAIHSWSGDPITFPTTAAEEASAIASQNSVATKTARARLWRAGWTREAVLERQPSRLETSTSPAWSVIDSPLQNRSASIAWMGWPMADSDRHPVDELPLSFQVPQRDPNEADSFALQTGFQDDADGDPGAPLWPTLLRPSDVAALPPAPAPLGMLKFASRGLRVGAQHRLMHYGKQLAALPVDPPRMNLVDGGLFGVKEFLPGVHTVMWDAIAMPPGEVGLQREGRQLTLSLKKGISQVRITGLSPQTVFADVTPLSAAVAPTQGGTVTLMVPDGPLPHFSVQHQKDGAWVELLVFPGVSTRLAGVFGKDRTLLAFGEEALVYQSNEQKEWIRSRSATLLLPEKTVLLGVMTVDLNGEVSTYKPQR